MVFKTFFSDFEQDTENDKWKMRKLDKDRKE